MLTDQERDNILLEIKDRVRRVERHVVPMAAKVLTPEELAQVQEQLTKLAGESSPCPSPLLATSLETLSTWHEIKNEASGTGGTEWWSEPQ